MNDEQRQHNNTVAWLICAGISLLANTWGILSISAKQKKWKPLEFLICTLAGTHILNVAIPVTIYSVVQLRKQHSQYEWNEGLCKVFVSTFYTLSLVTCFSVTSLSYHRMWMVRWPVNYSTVGSPVMSTVGSPIMSTVGSPIMCTVGSPIMCTVGFPIMSTVGSPIMSTVGFPIMSTVGSPIMCTVGSPIMCTHFLAHELFILSKLYSIPSFAIGMKAKVDICCCFLVVSFTSLKLDTSYEWMVLCVLWCTLVQALLLPMCLWTCDRYRADAKSVWDKCIAIMSNDDTDEDHSQDGGIHSDLLYERSYDYNYGGDVMAMDRMTKFDFSALERGIPQIYPMKEIQDDKMHYLQVPPTRRYSHDETDIWASGQIPAFLHTWGSAEDVAAISFFTLPRRDRRSSLVSYHEDCGLPYRKSRKSSESLISLKHFTLEELYKEDYKCFSREEVVSFIDETPLPSPRKTPIRSSSISLMPDSLQHQTLAHFALTDFDREPQVLRRFSAHGKGCTLNVPGHLRPHEDHRRYYTEGHRGHCSSQRHAQKMESQKLDDVPVENSGNCQTSLINTWTGQEHLLNVQSKGSTNSYLSLPSTSSGYITLHSDSIGSTS
ncbi:putative G-protein coupled receptor 153 [Pelodytes ibericus]